MDLQSYMNFGKLKCYLLVSAYNMDLLGDNIDTIMKNTETIIEASKGVGL